MVVRLAVAAGRCGRGKTNVDLRGSVWVSGIGRRVVVKDFMGNQANPMSVEERDRKNVLKSGAVYTIYKFTMGRSIVSKY